MPYIGLYMSVIIGRLVAVAKVQPTLCCGISPSSISRPWKSYIPNSSIPVLVL